MKKSYWNHSPLAKEITALIKRSPIQYGCSVRSLEAHVRVKAWMMNKA